MQVSIQLTGRVSVTSGQDTLDESRLPGRQGRLVFAHLVANRDRAVPRSELADALWGERLPKGWDSAVRMAVSRVRQALTEIGLTGDMLSGAFGCYQLLLPPGAQVDIETAETSAATARTALTLGDFEAAAAHTAAVIDIAGRPLLSGEDADWLETMRARLEALRVEALEISARAAIGSGRAPDAVRAAEAAVAADEFRESAHRTLMEAHRAAGNVAEALRAFARCKHVLASHLGVDPSPETRALHVELLQQDRPAAAGGDVHVHESISVVAVRTTGPFHAQVSEGAARFSGTLLRSDAVTSRAAFGDADDASAYAAWLLRRTSGAAAVGLAQGDAAEATRVADSLVAGAASGAAVASAEFADATRSFSRRLRRSATGAHLRWTPDAADLLITTTRPRAQGPFVGRADELAELRDALLDAAAGTRRAVLVTGEPGIGKSRLSAELLDLASANGAFVVHARCEEDENLPYAPFVAILRTLTAAVAVDELRVLLADAGDLVRLVPDLRVRLGLPAVPDDPDRLVLFAAVESFLASVARMVPLVLFLDDLHWADAETIALLRHVLRSPEESSLLILGACRDVAPAAGDPLSKLLRDVASDQAMAVLSLTGLTADEVSELAADLGDTADPAALVTRTGGNPFFVTELLRAGGDDLPRTVRETVLRHVDGLGREARDVLARTSVIGRSFAAEVVESIGELDLDGVLRTLDDAVRAGVVTEGVRAGTFEFAHDLVRESLYESLTFARRAHLHERVGEAVAELSAGDADAPVADIARHFLAGTRRERAVPFCLRAAARAVGMGAVHQAAELYRRALEVAVDELDRCDALLGLGTVDRLRRRLDAAASSFGEAADIASRYGDAERLAHAAVGTSGHTAELGTGDPRRLAWLRQALNDLPDGDSVLKVRVLASLGGASGSLSDCESYARRAVEMARRIGDVPALAFAIASLTWVTVQLGPSAAPEYRELAEEQRAIGAEARDLEIEAAGHFAVIFAATSAGDLRRVDAEIDVIAAFGERYGHGWPAGFARLMRAMRAITFGRFDEAVALGQEALSVGGRVEQVQMAYSAQRFWLHRERGTLLELEPSLLSLEPPLSERPLVRAFRAMLFAETARPDLAAREVEQFVEADDGRPLFIELLAATMIAADAALLADPNASPWFYDRLLPAAKVCGHVAGALWLGPVQRTLALLAARAGDAKEARERIALALGLLEAADAPVLLRRTRLEAARLGAGERPGGPAL